MLLEKHTYAKVKNLTKMTTTLPGNANQSLQIDVNLDNPKNTRLYTHKNTKQQLIFIMSTIFMFIIFLIFITYYPSSHNTEIDTIGLYALFGSIVLLSTIGVVIYLNIMKNRLRILQYNIDQNRLRKNMQRG